MRQIIIEKNDAGQRLDKFLKKATTALPDSLLYKYLRKKCVKLNGRHVSDGAVMLCAGDTLTLYMNDEFFATAQAPALEFAPNLTVAYEDEHLLVAEKEAGLSCHPDAVQKDKTLIDRILAYLYQKGEYDPKGEQSFAPALANRIDRNTAGLVMCAKDAETLRVLNAMIRAHRVTKEYRALVCGVPPASAGTLSFYLKKDAQKNRVTVFETRVPGAKSAVTEYETLRTDGAVSLLRIRLLTGRTHQIRASFAYIGCPLCGDTKYADGKEKPTCGFSHQALLSYALTFCPDPQEDAPLFYLNGKTVCARLDPRFA